MPGVTPTPQNWGREATRLGGVALAYLVAHKFAYFFPAAGQSMMAVWPANGIAVAVLLLSPRQRWPAILTVVLLTHFITEMVSGRSLVGELGYVLANFIEIFGSAWLIARWNALPVSFNRVSAVVTLLGAALGVTAFSAVIGGASAAYQSGLPFAQMYRSWWIADGLGLLVVTPVLVSWLDVKPEWIIRWSWRRGGELALVTGLALGLDWAYFGAQREQLLIKPVSYMLVVPLAWVALRFGVRSTATLLAILAVFEVSFTALELGSFPLGGADAAERLLMVQLFIGVKCAGTLLLASSFTERRLTETSLRASEARLRALGDNLPDSMVYQAVRERDGSMRFVYVSAGLQRMLGISAEAVLRDSGVYYQQMEEADRAAVAVAREKSLATMSVFDVAVRMRRLDGAVRWLHIRSQPFQLPDGRMAWDGLATDITVRREMEEALRASEEKFAKAFRSGPVAVSLTRLEDCQFMEVNAAMEKFLGYTREELLGATSATLSVWRTEAEHQQILAEARVKRSIHDREIAFRAKSGELVYAQYAAEVIEVGGADCLLSVLADITPQRRAQEELRRVNRALQTISHCNQVLVRATSEPELLEKICNLIVASGAHTPGSYKLAWVGYVTADAAQPVRVAAVAGEHQEELVRMGSTRPVAAHEQGPTLTAIRTGQAVVIHDFLNDARLRGMEEIGQRLGFRSCIALPLSVEGQVNGVLSIYSGDSDAFDAAEVRLLTEMAEDLAYGIHSLRAHARKEAAEAEVHRLLREAEAAQAALQSSLEEQKRGAAALRASEEQFRSALQNSPIGMAIVSTEGRWIEVNQEICRIVGYTREELLARDFQSITHPEDLERDVASVQRMLARKIQMHAIEKRYLHKDGHPVWCQLNVSLVWNPDGTPRHFISQIQDITQRKQAEAERSRLLAQLGERIKEMTALHRAAGLLQQERPFDQQLLAEFVAFLPPAWKYPDICEARVSFGDLEAQTPGWQESPWRQGVVFQPHGQRSGTIEVIYREVRPPEAEGPFLLEERALLTSLADMLAAYVDRKCAEAALQESRGALMEVNRRYARHEAALSTLTRSYAQRPEELQEILRRITETVATTLEVSRVGVWKYNATRTGLECLALFEFTSGQHSHGATVARAGHEKYFEALDNSDLIIAGDARQDPRTAVLATYLQELGIASLLDVPFHAHGAAAGVLSCEHCGTPRAWTPDEQTFVVAVANLVSMLFAQQEQQKLEVQLRQTQKLESLGTLAGGIAHDFNNILGAIISYTELTRQDHPNDAELQENLGEVLKASQRAVGLVRQILTFSRRQQQERKHIQLGPVVQEVLKLLRSTLPATIEIRAEIAEGLPPVIADVTQLHQVLMNLGTNAAHAMRGKAGILRVQLAAVNHIPGLPGLAAPPSHVQLTVSDTGCGMAPATLSRIFDPFFTTKSPGEGTGLGLAVVHGIVKEHQGEIHVESQPGVGTTFRIELPAAPAEPPDATTRFFPGAPAAGQRVLFVDDEVALGESARRLLGRHGFEVEWQARPDEALALFQRDPHRFAAVVTDLNMPAMTGSELAAQLLKVRRNLPVFIMTGYAGGLTGEAARAAGITALLIKPINYGVLAGQLLEAIAAAAENHEPGQRPLLET